MPIAAWRGPLGNGMQIQKAEPNNVIVVRAVTTSNLNSENARNEDRKELVPVTAVTSTRITIITGTCNGHWLVGWLVRLGNEPRLGSPRQGVKSAP